jgi:hypothetical protein
MHTLRALPIKCSDEWLAGDMVQFALDITDFSQAQIDRSVEAQIELMDLEIGEEAEFQMQGHDGLIYTFSLHRDT